MASTLPEVFIRKGRGRRHEERSREEATETFLRLDDDARCELLGEVIGEWIDYGFLNSPAVGGLFRMAWDSEPYLGGIRLGSYFSAVAAAAPGRPVWGMGEIADEWGVEMMTREERSRFSSMSGSLTLYRGGASDPAHLALGASWTTNLEVARFYAEAWPRRWGIEGPSTILRMVVDVGRVSALLGERQEAEALICDAADLRSIMDVVPIG